MNLLNAAEAVYLDSFSIGIGMTPDHKPAALILSYDTLENGAELAIQATSIRLDGSDLRLISAAGTVVLRNVGQAIQDAAFMKLPVVVLDPQRERESEITLWL